VVTVDLGKTKHWMIKNDQFFYNKNQNFLCWYIIMKITQPFLHINTKVEQQWKFLQKIKNSKIYFNKKGHQAKRQKKSKTKKVFLSLPSLEILAETHISQKTYNHKKMLNKRYYCCSVLCFDTPQNTTKKFNWNKYDLGTIQNKNQFMK